MGPRLKLQLLNNKLIFIHLSYANFIQVLSLIFKKMPHSLPRQPAAIEKYLTPSKTVPEIKIFACQHLTKLPKSASQTSLRIKLNFFWKIQSVN